MTYLEQLLLLEYHASTLETNFSDSLIIYKENTEEISVWKSDEKLLIFASLISPSNIILFDKSYQAWEAVFYHQMKHLEDRQKYSAARPVFSALFSVVSSHAWYST